MIIYCSVSFQVIMNDKETKEEKEEALLLNARHGKLKELVDILKHQLVDINCKGKQKSNLGWSPLHLAAYFGHQVPNSCLICKRLHIGTHFTCMTSFWILTSY